MRITRSVRLWGLQVASIILCLGLLTITLILWGCGASSNYVVHQGSIPIITSCPVNSPPGSKCDDGGSFDSHTADFLSEERAFLDTFKGKTEPAPVTEALGYAEKQYAVTKASYLTWRTAQTAATLADLNQQKTSLTSAVGNVAQAQTGGAK